MSCLTNSCRLRPSRDRPHARPPPAQDRAARLRRGRRQARILQPDRFLQRPDGAGDDRRRREARHAPQRHARRRIHRRQHGLVAGDGLRDQGLRVSSALVRRFLAGEARHDARVRRRPRDRAERRRQGDAGAVRSLQGPHRRADEGPEHLLDGSVQQPRCARRLRGHRPRARRASRECRCVRRRGWIRRHARRRLARVERSPAARLASLRSNHRRRPSSPPARAGRIVSKGSQRDSGRRISRRISTTKSASSTRTTAAQWPGARRRKRACSRARRAA